MSGINPLLVAHCTAKYKGPPAAATEDMRQGSLQGLREALPAELHVPQALTTLHSYDKMPASPGQSVSSTPLYEPVKISLGACARAVAVVQQPSYLTDIGCCYRILEQLKAVMRSPGPPGASVSLPHCRKQT